MTTFHEDNASNRLPAILKAKEPLKNMVTSRKIQILSETHALATETYQVMIRQGAINAS
ncbi:MAG: hypothetical protein WC285_04070 [Candidatus Gracilibacteria bacterium]